MLDATKPGCALTGKHWLKLLHYSRSGYYLDCMIDDYEVWTIHHFCKRTEYFTDNMQFNLSEEEFISTVASKTPEYLSDILFFLPNPDNYLDQINEFYQPAAPITN